MIAVGVPTPVSAAPPANDSIFAAPRITVPTVVRRDVTEATHDSATDDPPADCVLGQSIWFRLRTVTTRRVQLETTGSGYDTILAVYRGTPSALALVSCVDDTRLGVEAATEFVATAGVTYFIAVSTCCDPSAAVPGATAVLSLHAPRPVSVSTVLSSARAGVVSGRAFISGSTTCVGTPVAPDIFVTISQRNRTFLARGSSSTSVPCDRAGVPWTVRVDSETAVAFNRGQAVVTPTSTVCGLFACASHAPGDQVVTLGSAPNTVVTAEPLAATQGPIDKIRPALPHG